MYYSQGFGQTITYLQNGKIISETNGSLLDITNGDSLLILKKLILIKYSPGISNDSITLIEQTNDLEGDTPVPPDGLFTMCPIQTH